MPKVIKCPGCGVEIQDALACWVACVLEKDGRREPPGKHVWMRACPECSESALARRKSCTHDYHEFEAKDWEGKPFALFVCQGCGDQFSKREA